MSESEHSYGDDEFHSTSRLSATGDASGAQSKSEDEKDSDRYSDDFEMGEETLRSGADFSRRSNSSAQDGEASLAHGSHSHLKSDLSNAGSGDGSFHSGAKSSVRSDRSDRSDDVPQAKTFDISQLPQWSAAEIVGAASPDDPDEATSRRRSPSPSERSHASRTTGNQSSRKSVDASEMPTSSKAMDVSELPGARVMDISELPGARTMSISDLPGRDPAGSAPNSGILPTAGDVGNKAQIDERKQMDTKRPATAGARIEQPADITKLAGYIPPLPPPEHSGAASSGVTPQLRQHTWPATPEGLSYPISRPVAQEPLGRHLEHCPAGPRGAGGGIRGPFAAGTEEQLVDRLAQRFMIHRKSPERQERAALEAMLSQVAFTALEPRAADEMARLFGRRWLMPISSTEGLRAFRRCLHSILTDQRVLEIMEVQMHQHFGQISKMSNSQQDG